MKRVLFVICLFLSACSGNGDKSSRFSKEQISSLNLSDTKVLKVKNDSIKTVDLNPFLKKRQFKMSEIISSIKMVPLETSSDESLLGNIRKIVVSEDYIYIMDDLQGAGLVIFDKLGRFVKRIPYGQGPGELYRLYNIDYDKSKQELVTLQHSYLLFYTKDGKYLRRKKVPFYVYDFSVTPTGYIFKSRFVQKNRHLGKFQENSFFVTDKNFSIEAVGLKNLNLKNVFSGRFYLHTGRGKVPSVMVSEAYRDTIYEYNIDKKELESVYKIDLSDKQLPKRCLNLKSSDRFKKTISENNYYFFLGDYHETTSHNVFFLSNWYLGYTTVVFRDKHTGNLFGGVKPVFDNGEYCPYSVIYPQATYGKYFISVYTPSKGEIDHFKEIASPIISADDITKVENFKEDDNPMLVFFELKSF